MQIKLLMNNSINCKVFEKRVLDALKSKKIYAEIEKIDYLPDIMSFGVIYTPALVVNGEVVSSGKLLSVEQISQLIHKMG